MSFKSIFYNFREIIIATSACALIYTGANATKLYAQFGAQNVPRPDMTSGEYEKWNGSSWTAILTNNLLASATSDISVNNQKITNLATPSLSSQATNKDYVDTQLLTKQNILTFPLSRSLGGWGADISLLSTGFLTQTASNTWAVRSFSAPVAGFSITNPAGIAGNPTFTLTNDLLALEGLSSTGFAARTTTDTWAQRTLTAPSAGFTITNPAGIAGNPTFVLANDLLALENLSTTGIVTRTALDTITTRSLTAPAAGLTISNNDAVAGNPTFALANDIAGIESLTGLGFAVRFATDSWVLRSLSAGTGISISNVDGSGANPSISLSNVGTAGTYATPSSITTNAQGQITSITAGSASSPGSATMVALLGNGTNTTWTANTWIGISPQASTASGEGGDWMFPVSGTLKNFVLSKIGGTSSGGTITVYKNNGGTSTTISVTTKVDNGITISGVAKDTISFVTDTSMTTGTGTCILIMAMFVPS